MGYFTIKNEAVSEFEEKKSVFIGHALRVCEESEARDFVNRIRGEHKEARHNVYAYIIGENMGIQRYSDDGEPQGTAGVPVLDAIKKNGVTDVAVVVTRYFGGVLLGKGGLVRAYSKAASDAIKEGEIVERVKGAPLTIDIEYDALGKLQYMFEQNGWFIEDTVYTDKVKVMTYCEADKIQEVSGKVTEALSGRCTISEGDPEYFFKNPEGKLSLK
ncbi:MAG: thymidylate synthase [Firmicutes bacterium]|nr:thymidylate synthase [Bacillota bacterium]